MDGGRWTVRFAEGASLSGGCQKEEKEEGGGRGSGNRNRYQDSGGEGSRTKEKIAGHSRMDGIRQIIARQVQSSPMI